MQSYPLLTMEMLEDLDDKLLVEKFSIDDFRFVNHYLTSLGYPDHLKNLLAEIGLDSFREAASLLVESRYNFKDMTYAKLLGRLMACVEDLMDHVNRGEKIY